MSASNTSNRSLPRTLKPSVLTYVRVVGVVYVALLFLIGTGGGSSETLGVFGVMGAVLLAIYGAAAYATWQALTLFHDHLEFATLKEKRTVFYQEVDEVKAVVTGGSGPKSIPFMVLYLHLRGGGTNPLMISLQSFKACDQILLLQLIKQGAPGAHFNSLAEKVRQR